MRLGAAAREVVMVGQGVGHCAGVSRDGLFAIRFHQFNGGMVEEGVELIAGPCPLIQVGAWQDSEGVRSP